MRHALARLLRRLADFLHPPEVSITSIIYDADGVEIDTETTRLRGRK